MQKKKEKEEKEEEQAARINVLIDIKVTKRTLYTHYDTKRSRTTMIGKNLGQKEKYFSKQ
jgi:hypothetical protein